MALLSIFVGFLAMGSPVFFSVVIAQFLGIFALVSGVISLFVAIFGKHFECSLKPKRPIC